MHFNVQVLHCSAVIAPNQDVAFMISIFWTAIQLLLSGFFVNFNEVRGHLMHYPILSIHPLHTSC